MSKRVLRPLSLTNWLIVWTCTLALGLLLGLRFVRRSVWSILCTCFPYTFAKSMEGGKWNSIQPGLYICLRTDRTVSPAAIQPIVGAFYRNLPLDTKKRRAFALKKGLKTLDYGLVERVKDEHEFCESALVIYNEAKMFQRCFYGPLREGEVMKFAAAYRKEERVQRYFAPFLDDVHRLKPGDAVQVIRDSRTYTGTLRRKGAFPRPKAGLQLDKEEMWLGIELSPEFAGMGNSVDVLDRARSFPCREDCALYLYFPDLIRDRRCIVKNPAYKSWESLSVPQGMLTAIVSQMMDYEGILNPDTVVLVSNLQQAMRTTLPFPPHYHLKFVTNTKELVNRYGMDNYKEDIAVVKNLPDLALFREIYPYTFLVIGSRQTCKEAFENLDLDELSFRPNPVMAERIRQTWAKVGPSYKALFRFHTDAEEDSEGMMVTLAGVWHEMDCAQNAWTSSRLSGTKGGSNGNKTDHSTKPTVALPGVTEPVHIQTVATLPDYPTPEEYSVTGHAEGSAASVQHKYDNLPGNSAAQPEERGEKKKSKKKKKRKKKQAVSNLQNTAEKSDTGREVPDVIATLPEDEAGVDDPEQTLAEPGEIPDPSTLRGTECIENQNGGTVAPNDTEGPIQSATEVDTAQLIQAAQNGIDSCMAPEEIWQIAPAEDDQNDDCVVCLSEPQSVAFVPCGHRHTCPDCAQKIYESDSPFCPTCRGEIQQYIRIWI